MASPWVEEAKNAMFTGLDYMAMPGDYLRGALAGRAGDRLTGREMLENWGVLGANQEGLDIGDVAGFGVDLIADPINLALGGAGLLAGVGKAGVRGLKGLTGLARGGKAADTYQAAKSAMGAIPGALKSTPALAASIGSPIGGAYLLSENEQGSDLQDLLGLGMIAAPFMLPLGMAAARKAKGGLAAAKADVQPTKQGPFYSRLEEAILGAPEKFETRPEAVRIKPGRTIELPDGTTKVIPDQRVVTPGATAYDQMRSYLEGRAHPQEIDWVLGSQFADSPIIERQSLLDAFQQGKINLETQRRGGPAIKSDGWEYGFREKQGPTSGLIYEAGVAGTKEEAKKLAVAISKENDGTSPVVRRSVASRQHGPLEFPDMLIPGGRSVTEVPIKLQGGGFPDVKGHFGDDIVAWTIHDQRKMPDGKTATFVQELQSDWHQQGAKQGYGKGTAFEQRNDAGDMSVWMVRRPDGTIEPGVWRDRASAEAFAQSIESAPNAPFKGNEWTKLGIKQAMADAIARGDDYVLFPPPELVSRTQGMPIEKARKFYGEIVPNLANEMLKPHGVKLEKMSLPGYKKARDALGFKIPDSMKQQAQTKGFPLMSVLPPAAGAALLGTNDENDPTKSAIGTALLLGGMGLPLAMAMKRVGGKKPTGWARQVAEFNAAEDAKVMQRIAEAKTPEEATRLQGLLSTAGKQAPVAAPAPLAATTPRAQYEADFLEQLGFWDANRKSEAFRAVRDAGIADVRAPEAEPILRAMAPPGLAGMDDWASRVQKAMQTSESTRKYISKESLNEARAAMQGKQ